MAPRYLDFSHEELTGNGNDHVLYCACGHWKRMTPDDFRKLPGLSLYAVVARLKCSACGRVGEVPQITVLPRHTGGFGG